MNDDDVTRRRGIDGYEPRFDLDLAYGQQGELLVADVAEAIANGMVEVKRDGRWASTGNLYVERRCRRASGRYEPSGISTSSATLWAFVLGGSQVMVIIPTTLLRTYCEELWRSPYRRRDGSRLYSVEERDGSHPTKGFKVPLDGFFAWLKRRERVA